MQAECLTQWLLLANTGALSIGVFAGGKTDRECSMRAQTSIDQCELGIFNI